MTVKTTLSAPSLIVGLGNHGKEYINTRHNAGFWLVDAWAAWNNATFHREAKFKAEIALFKHENRDVRFVKPLTFMNLSGESVGALMRFYDIATEQVLIVHDELDIAPGSAKLKIGGGLAGHNGLKSLAQHTGSRDFWRLRLGIGRPTHANHNVANYVLGKPTTGERQAIGKSIEEVIEIERLILSGEMEETQQWLHSPPEARKKHRSG